MIIAIASLLSQEDITKWDIFRRKGLLFLNFKWAQLNSSSPERHAKTSLLTFALVILATLGQYRQISEEYSKTPTIYKQVRTSRTENTLMYSTPTGWSCSAFPTCNIRTGRFLKNSIIGRSSDNFSAIKLAVLTCRNPIIYKEFNFSLKQRILTAKILNCSILSSSRCLPYTPSTLPPPPLLPPSPHTSREKGRSENGRVGGVVSKCNYHLFWGPKVSGSVTPGRYTWRDMLPRALFLFLLVMLAPQLSLQQELQQAASLANIFDLAKAGRCVPPLQSFLHGGIKRQRLSRRSLANIWTEQFIFKWVL